jgi:isoleucyl-tRNA synthetase
MAQANKNDNQRTQDTKQERTIPEREEDVLAFWREHDIFEQSIEKDAPKGEFVFYDGPPFATGLPHYGHILASTIKDAVPRYQTMRGYRVNRKWGWDCHGLPLENEIEKELGLATKRDIEEHGVEAFNERAREAVLRYADSWREIIPRLGRWVDMEDDYRTMDPQFMESVWWVFKRLYDTNLAYKSFKAMHLCPRCGTTLSNFEVNQGYRDITDIAVTVKLPLADEENTYLLAWTTTPWTLPGNMAAAVHRDATYVKCEMPATDGEANERYILAKELLQHVVGDSEYTVLEELSGRDLVGRQYRPPFQYFVDAALDQKANAWHIYHADYVSLDEGTGIVHLAPAFGEEDLTLAQEQGVPIVHHVDEEGHFIDAVSDFAGQPVKPKSDPQATDIEVLKKLAHDGLLFAKEKVEHSYPHCWRCDTPLLNYATSSWFVQASALRDKLLKENDKIDWVPREVGEGRFRNWLANVRDWAVSRSRYWGAPLPVWQHPNTDERYVFGSVRELSAHARRSGNTYHVMRHGEAQSNRDGVIDCTGRNGTNPLTEDGVAEVRETAAELKAERITRIVCSPLTRTYQTAQTVAEELGLDSSAIVTDERLKEIQLGELNGQPIEAYQRFAETYEERFDSGPAGGESVADVKRRIGEALYDIDDTYENETILLVAHEYPLWMLKAAAEGLSREATLNLNNFDNAFMETGQAMTLSFTRQPHNRDFELDLHRPYIDEFAVYASDGARLERVADVFDCWFESGAMPYAQHHYPFENTDDFEPKPGLFRSSRGYPADFIAEGLDQTRGWFYTLLVLGVGLFGKRPYKNVIVNGTVLAEDGQKMSKRLKNYPDPMDIIHRYGADSLRYYLLSSPVMRSEDLNFSEEGVAEVQRKNVTRLDNVRSFYFMYHSTAVTPVPQEEHILDRYINARLNQLIKQVTEHMDAYEIDRAARPVGQFIDDLSTWYLRRSRDRFKGSDERDRAAALATTRYVLRELAKVMAPFMPFFADDLYASVRTQEDPISVHLAPWPMAGAVDEQLIDRMTQLRHVVSLGLEQRSNYGIKVRQPLARLSVRDTDFHDDERHLMCDELNVKEVVYEPSLHEEVALDTNITPDLEAEGQVRELLRHVQELRKQHQLTPEESIELTVATDPAFQNTVAAHEGRIADAAQVASLRFAEPDDPKTVTVGEHDVRIGIIRRSV